MFYKLRVVAVVMLFCCLFSISQPAFAGWFGSDEPVKEEKNENEEVAKDVALGTTVGVAIGAALVFFTGGAALPVVLGAAAAGAGAAAAISSSNKDGDKDKK